MMEAKHKQFAESLRNILRNNTGNNTRSDNRSKSENLIIPPEDNYDLQAELERKFDELFGPLDEDDIPD